MANTKKEEKTYKIHFTYLDEVKEGSFDSVFEGLKEFSPKTIKNRVILVVDKSGRKYNRVLFAPHARRIFFNENALQIFSRNVQRALP